MLMKYFKISDRRCQNWLNNYNLKKDRKKVYERYSLTCLEKYGVENISSLKEVRNKVKNTLKEKYGDDCYNNRTKAKETTLLKYGVENASSLKEIRNKVKNTLKEKYGNEKYVNIDKIKQVKRKKYGDDCYNNRTKAKETMLLKYGENNPSRIHYDIGISEILDDKEKLKLYIIENNIINGVDLADRLGISNNAANNAINRNNLRYLFNYSGSIGENEVRAYINQYYETENNNRNIIHPYELDIYIPIKKIAIEYNGKYWHSKKKQQTIDKIKFDKCNELGIKLLTIWDYEWKFNKIKVIEMLNKELQIEDKEDAQPWK